MERAFIILSGVNGFLAVALGAFGAHGLRASLAKLEDGPRRLEVWETAAHYHLVHAVALGFVAYLCTRSQPSVASWAGWAFQAGIVVFSGSLYALSISGVKLLGAVTPLGGLFFLAGWLLVAWVGWKA